ncbi:cold shock domain-containing protein C2-like [Tubulanus polymorphus]|uniref:cold shock domain-containing protein C2-like n=1 Tax=Tubulanus polymorphus TaxID=672921 RepID=UPI003DA52E57
MSESKSMPDAQSMNNAQLTASPTPPKPAFLTPLPHPFKTKRTRTVSQSERALEGPTFYGVIQEFCRNRGHGFIIPHVRENGDERLFVHISDIDGEYVPKVGDEVAFKKVLVPPKKEKYQACHVQIVHMVAGQTHEKWDSS